MAERRVTNHNLNSEPLILGVHGTAYRVAKFALDMTAPENAAIYNTIDIHLNYIEDLKNRIQYTMTRLADNPDSTNLTAELEHLKAETDRIIGQLPNYHTLLDTPMRGTRVQFFEALTEEIHKNIASTQKLLKKLDHKTISNLESKIRQLSLNFEANHNTISIEEKKTCANQY